jgi:class 3 adenylate cyclase
MTDYSQARAIMFADVVGSSSLYKLRGNSSAKTCIDATLAAMSGSVLAHGGIVVKTIGDEIMTCFNSAFAACECAQALQQLCSGGSELQTIRIGIAYGNTLSDENDVFGDTVNDAACVAQIAHAQQIVITQAVFDALGPQQVDCQEFDRVQLKGTQEKSLIYRLHWESAAHNHNATTVMSVHDITQQLERNKLTLWVGEEQHTVLADQTPFIIGRDRQKAHLHVDSNLASRDHCRITFQRGRFVLVDHSTNGTYVSPIDAEAIYLRRTEYPLTGEGAITIGQPQQGSYVIHYNT